MNYHSVDKKALLVWRIRLCVMAALVLSLMQIMLYATAMVWFILWGLLGAAFLVMFFWYYPLKYRKLSYAAEGDIVVINCGVIYTRRKSIIKNNIQYTTIITPPLFRVFGLCGIIFRAAGGDIYLPGIKRADAVLLQKDIAANGGEGAK